MVTDDVRTAVSNMLDGIKFNKEKLARDCVAVCDLADRLKVALAEEQQKSAALALQVERLEAFEAPDMDWMPPGFEGMFGKAPGTPPEGR